MNKKLISIFLTVALLICTVPLTAISSQPGEQPVAQVEELTALRDAFTKHYSNTDGSNYAVVFPEQVHYLSGDAWKEIDNSLTYDQTTGKYVSNNALFPVSFSANAASSELISLSDGEYTLSWSISFGNSGGLELMALENADSVSASTAAVVDMTTEASLQGFGKAVSGIQYASVFGNAVDLEYFVYHGKIKENVILNSLGDFTSYTLTVNVGALTAVKNSDGSVSFVDSENNGIFTLGAPWMHDAGYAVSDSIAVTVTQSGSTARITYTPSREWLTAADRSYPVLIDPVFLTRQYTSNIEDTYVYEGDSASATRAAETTLKVGVIDGKTHYAYIKFNEIPEILTNGQAVTMNVRLGFCADITGSCEFKVSEVLFPWSADTITYATRPAENSLYPETATATYVMSSEGAFCGVDITSHIGTDWSSWRGEMIELVQGGTYSSVSLYSAENARTGARPYLTINYWYYSPEFIEEGAIYSFRNAASNMYLTVAEDANGANAYQSELTGGTVGENQAFRLKINASGSLLFGAICSSDGGNRAIGFNYSGAVDDALGYVPQNLYLSKFVTNSKSSGWRIIDVSDDIDGGDETLFIIVSSSDPTLALTANGLTAGSASGSDITSAGNVYVAPYTGDASQHWHIESGGCVQDVTCSNIKSLHGTTATYYRNSGYIPLSCPAVTFGETVTWTSSNVNVATVDANGICDIKEAGYARIIAHALDTTYIYDIYVRFRDGVYTFTNNVTGKRLSFGTENAINGESLLELVEVESSAHISRTDMFKLEYISDGRYYIKSMLNSDMYLTVAEDPKGLAGESYLVCDPPMFISDSDVLFTLMDEPCSTANAIYQKFTIERWSESGYSVKGLGGLHLMPNLQNSAGTGYQVIMQIQSEIDVAACSWTIDQVYAVDSGITIRNPHPTVVVGGKYAFDAVVYTPVTSWSTDGSIVWSVTNGTGSASINSSTGVLTGISVGVVTVRASYVVDGSVKFFEEFDVTVIPIQSATYFIGNENYGLYLDAELSGGSFIPDIVWDLYSTQDTALRWKFVHVYEDYYYIVNVNSGCYLTIFRNVIAGQVAFLESSPAGDNLSLWKVVKLPSGSYKIQPHNCVGTDLALYTRNHDLRIYNYDETSAECVFQLRELELTAVNYVHSSFSNTLPQSYIDKAYEFVNFIYMKYFNVSITVEGAPIVDTISGIDTCTLGPCNNSCGTSCTEHHKNLRRISNVFYNAPRKNGYVYTLWTNADYFCVERSGQHTVVNILGVCSDHRPVVHITSAFDLRETGIDCTSEEIAEVAIASLAYSLAHELAHSFKLDEVYGEAHHDVAGDTCCIMESFDYSTAYEFYQKVLSGEAEAFCPSCRAALSEYLSGLVIEGNS